ncbi:MAG: hypothetical protein NDI94_04455 [Candidatus Woesearchaeota archaeon]|nr:hypothetical protein [Candidatus Woesearchaeota archaeon]
MDLISLLDKVTEPIFMPDLSSDPGFEHASFTETVAPYPKSSRLLKAFNNPPKVTWREEGKISGILPREIGSYNLGPDDRQFPVVSSYIELLRNEGINPAVPPDVEYFQRTLAGLSVLVMPLMLARITADKFGERSLEGADVSVLFDPSRNYRREDIIHSTYANIFLDRPNYMPDPVVEVTYTIGGARSSASIIPRIHEYAPLIKDIEGCDSMKDLNISFIAIHRGGIETSLVAAAVASQFGITSSVIGVDAKRRHEDGPSSPVAGVDVTLPPGYASSEYSRIIGDSFVTPDKRLIVPGKKNIHVFFDPMLATGVSTEETIIQYQKAIGCEFDDIYVISLFAGGYDGIDKLVSLGVNVHVLGVHDQAHLNSVGYIQPGLGDAGDKQFGTDKITTPEMLLEKLTGMYANLASFMPKMQKELFHQFNGYAIQMTGNQLKI